MFVNIPTTINVVKETSVSNPTFSTKTKRVAVMFQKHF